MRGWSKGPGAGRRRQGPAPRVTPRGVGVYRGGGSDPLASAAVQDDEHVQTETLAAVTCANCGCERQPGELWRIFPTADAGEVYWFCPTCSETEFGALAGD